MGIEGRIHSIETMGTLDGPDPRFVVFVQGCCLGVLTAIILIHGIFVEGIYWMLIC